MTYRWLLLALALVVSGCGGKPVPPSKLVGPASALMVAPDRLPDIAAGEDIGRHTVKVRRMYGREASKLRRLQRYVRAVTK